MIDVAYAAGPGGTDTMSLLMSVAPLVLIFIVFYFLLILPQKKKAQQHKEMLDGLQKGDDVITSGGIHGRIVGIADNVLTLDVGEKVKIKVSREYITQKKGVEATQK